MTIYNEKEYAKDLYERQRDPSLQAKAYTVWELTILAKYLRQELKQSESEIKTNIIKFCNLNYPGFDADVEYDRINKVVRDCYKTDLRQSLPVPITKKEWSDIQKGSTEKRQKLLFVILAVAKFNRLNPIVYTEDETEKEYTDNRLRCFEKESDLYKLMKMKLKNDKFKYLPYSEFGKLGLNLIEIPNSNKFKRILNYGEIDAKEEDILIKIEDFNKLPEYFLALQEDKRIKICEKCNKIYIDTSKTINSKYCKHCRKEKKLIKTVTGEKEIRCQECGKRFLVNSKNNTTTKCKECKDKVSHRKNSIITEKECIKCGKVFSISTKSRREICDECYKEYRQNYKKEKNKIYKLKEHLQEEKTKDSEQEI